MPVPPFMPPGLQPIYNDPQNPPVLVLMSRGYNTGLSQRINAAPVYPRQQGTDITGPPQFAAASAIPHSQSLSSNLPQGSAGQITELGAMSTCAQPHNLPMQTVTL